MANLSEELIRTLLASDKLSINVTLVGGAVGGQTVAQGDPNGGGADSWPVAGTGGEQLSLNSTLTDAQAAPAANVPSKGFLFLGSDYGGTAKAYALKVSSAGLLSVTSTQLPAALGAGGGIKVDGSGTALPVSSTTLATETTLASLGQPTTSTAVTPSDSTDLTSTATKGIWVGGAGDLSIKLTNDSAATSILAVPAGTFIPGAFKRVMAATTATSIVAFS